VLRRGLELAGARSRSAHPSGHRFWLRYSRVAARWLGRERRAPDVLDPEFCQKDVPLARCLAALGRGASSSTRSPPGLRRQIVGLGLRSGSLAARWNC